MEVDGKVVVVTGGASGIGLAAARAFGLAGARVVVADVEADALDTALKDLQAEGVDARTARVDVRSRAELEALAARVEHEHGGTDVLCNNAGVLAAPAWMWEAPREDQEWVFSVNFWGILNGIQAFVPRMIDRGTPAFVVNTSSISVFAPMAGASSYMMSKSAVVTLSETLACDLEAVQAPVRVAVVLPEHFKTRLGSAHRNRATREEAGDRVWAPIWDEADDPMLATGADPSALGQRIVAAVLGNRFWILPGAEDAMSVAAVERLREIERSFG